MRVFRLCKRAHAATVLSGEGGLYADGRWHPLGRRVVYCASSEALAVLEVRVHLGRVLPKVEFTMHELEVPDAALVRADPATLPADWARVPLGPASQRYGAAWLEARTSLALVLPSVHSQTDHSVLLNPAHPAIDTVRVLARREYRFDGRLF